MALKSDQLSDPRSGKHAWRTASLATIGSWRVSRSSFALAIADFHHPADGEQLASLIYTQSALWMYLYGKKFHGAKVGNRLVIEAVSIATRAYGEKKVESGFFDGRPIAQDLRCPVLECRTSSS
ncbi:MAG: hypothetical protein U5R48_15560 [Gammaproteobacteria bacterium]|nr:hypothetical protein [Gammaproteobacteria bacterium]